MGFAGRMVGLGAVVVLGWVSAARAERPWALMVNGPVVVKARPIPGTAVQEIWAEGDMQAPVQGVQQALLDVPNLAGFMPYVKEAREVGRDVDGSRHVYTRLQLPWVQGRDFVIHLYVDHWASAADGIFEDHWYAEPNYLPKKYNLIRLKTDQGRWRVTPNPDGTCHASYRFAVDPGGWLPGFVVAAGNKSAVLQVFRAVEAEARKRAGLQERAQARRPLIQR